MPFKGVTFARKLIIQGAAVALAGYNRAKIIGTINAGNPQFQFFTGSPDELNPALIWVNVNTSFNPDQLQLQLTSPESADGSEASLLLISNSTALNRTNAQLTADTINILGGSASNAAFAIGNGGAVDISSDSIIINMSSGGIRFSALGRRMVCLGGGTASPNASGGVGTIDIAHSFGNIANTFITINGEGTGAFRIFNRVPGGDTASTFQCRVINRDGTVPPNGTAINCQWNGIEYV